MNAITESIVTVATLVVGVALLALIVSRRSNTAGVIQAAASGFGNVLNVAVSPVTGGSMTGNLSYPSMAQGGWPLLN